MFRGRGNHIFCQDIHPFACQNSMHRTLMAKFRQFCACFEDFIPKTSIKFPNRLNCFTRIFKYLGDIKIENITKADIVDFITSLQTKETITRKFRNGKEVVTKQSLAFNNILKHYQVLSAVFSEAYQIDDLIAVNPMDKVPRPAPRKNDAIKEMHTFTVKEIRHILECLENEPLQWQVIIRLMIDTGARRGEIAGLRWKSVDFNNKTIKIENNLQYSPKIGVYETTPKGKKNRTIDIDPEIMALMQSLRDTQKVKTLKDYCFTQPDTGSPIFPQSPTKYLKTFGKKYGIKNLHPHALRHSAATIAVTHGANIAGVAAKLGHSDTSTTLDRYTHADQNAIKMGNETYRKALRKKAK